MSEFSVFRKRNESYSHTFMKSIVANFLKNNGLDVKTEHKTYGQSSVDVVGFGNEGATVVEVETLKYPCGNKLVTSFSKAVMKFGKIEPVLCIPKFVDFKEIWIVDESGNIAQYKRTEQLTDNH